MAILYNLYRNPPAGNQQEAVGLHARFVPSGKTTTAQLVSRAAKGSALGEGDLLAALYCLEQALLSELEAGHVVQFGSLGSFSLSLEGRKVIDEKEIRSASVSVRDLVLRTSVDCKRRLQLFQLQRSSKSGSSMPLDEVARDIKLQHHFEQNLVLTTRQYQEMRQCKKGIAIKELAQLVQQGVLAKVGSHVSTMYVLPEKGVLLDNNP